MDRPATVIERLRVERGLTQAEACRRGSLARATWSNVESGRAANPTSETKLRIARALGVRPSSIWRVRPRPLHLEDTEDPRWAAGVRAMARRLEREAPARERRRFADRLIAVLDQADRGSGRRVADEDRWEEFWDLASSLTIDPDMTPIEIVDGRLVERELDRLTPAGRMLVVAARRRRGRGRGAAAGSGGCS